MKSQPQNILSSTSVLVISFLFKIKCCRHGACEKACGKGGQKKEASPEIHSGLYPPCRRWNHGCRQFCKLPPDATLDSSEPFQILLRRHTGACLFAGSGCSAVLDVGFDSGSLSGSGSKPCFLRGVTVKSKGDALEQVTARRPPFLLQFPKRSYLKFIWWTSLDPASPLHLGVFRCKLGPDADVLGPGAACALGLMLGSGALDRGQHLL